MLIENAFTVRTPVDELWAFLLDVERIAPCMPGAELTETVDETTWKGKVSVKFGPVAMAFAGTVEMTERDDDAHRAVLRAKGMEQRGKGAANATVTSWLEPADDGSTMVRMTADITLSGAAAQMSRGLLPEISKKLTQQFADCLEAAIGTPAAAGTPPQPAAHARPSANASEPPASGAAPTVAASSTPAMSGPTVHQPAVPPSPSPGATTAAPATARPVGGIGLGLSALWSLVVGFFRRLFGGGPSGS